MEYKVTMPILSDTMDKGKLVKWRVKEGDAVKEGQVIAEVESDKATMEVQSFVNGTVKKLLVKEGEEVPVKTPIAIIETDAGDTSKSEKRQTKRETQKTLTQKTKKQKEEVDIEEIINSVLSSGVSKPQGVASPAAKKTAKEIGIDIEELQKNGELPKPAHEKDVKELLLKRYFTPKALKTLKDYGLNPEVFKFDHKIFYEEVMEYIIKNDIPKTTKLTPNQLAVIKTVENALSKPTYLLFDKIVIKRREGIKVTAQIIKALANAMQKNPLTRSVLKEDKLLTYPSSNISVAVSRDDGLFMCVIKNAQNKSLEEITEWLKEIKTKKLNIEDLSGSTFGISNLGMFGVQRFTALINQNDCAIAAFGAMDENGKIKVTFTIDHRILNGVDAAKFAKDFKEECKNV
jgi:pyruvate dehydrogenase E2 component (dihydrolipoamide acetyltransferase)